ncbi:hypothetical protein [Lysobacter sp. A421]
MFRLGARWRDARWDDEGYETMTTMNARFPAWWRYLPAAALLVVLSGCATVSLGSKAGYPEYMAEADAAVRDDLPEQALQAYRQAALADPARKQPWQQIALLQAQAGQPEAALVACQEVLRRDPADQQAGELFIDSGLDIAQETLRRLRATDAAQVEPRRKPAEALLAQIIEVFGEQAIPAGILDQHAKKAIEAYRSRLPRRSVPLPGEPLPEQPVADPLDVLGVK